MKSSPLSLTIKKLPKKIWLPLLLLLGVYGCFEVAFPSNTLRYRLTLQVDDNGKISEGSSVIEIYRQNTSKTLGSFGGYGYEFKGEAVAVDLGDKGVLFALLKGDGTRNPREYSKSEPPYIIFAAFRPLLENTPDPIEGMKILKREKPKATLPANLIPMLVRFRDINDPKTVERVAPDDLEKNFGSGVKLVSASIEITKDGVTRGIERYLTWLPYFYNSRLDGARFGTGDAKNRLANDLSSGIFSTEVSPHE